MLILSQIASQSTKCIWINTINDIFFSYVDNGKRNIGLFVFKNTRKVEIEIIDTKLGGAIGMLSNKWYV